MTKSNIGRATIILGLAFALPDMRFSAHAQTADTTSGAAFARQGEEAVRSLEEQGLYKSLQDGIAAARYEIRRDDPQTRGHLPSTYRASNPAQRYDAGFTPHGLSLTSARSAGATAAASPPATDWRAAIRFSSYGYGENLSAVGSPELAAQGNRIEYRRISAPVTEWYVNQAGGLEQGFTIAAPPVMKAHGERLRLMLELTGDLRADPSERTNAVTLKLANGEEVLSYSNLHAHDAQGRELPSEMKATETQIILEVDDEGATYPLTIDPLFTQQARLIGSDGALPGADHFGYSVAIYWNTVVVGSPDDDGGRGAAYVFVRNGVTWTQQQKLTAPYPAPNDHFGRSVAIYSNTIVVGAPNDDYSFSDQGTAFVFVRNGSTWSVQQQLTASDGGASDLFGFSVAIDAYTGNTIVIGAPLDDVAARVDQGSAYVFGRSGTVWILQQKLLAGNGAAGDKFGWSVGVEAFTAGTIVVGAPHAGSSEQGAAYLFVRNNGSWIPWTQLTAFDGALGDEFGNSVSISLTGNRIVVGAPLDDIGANTDQGSAYLFLKNIASWSLQQKLIANDGAAGDKYGWSVAVSGYDFSVGGPYDDIGATADRGSAYTYVCNGPCGPPQKLTSNIWSAGDLFGMSVAIDAGGTSSVAVGEPWGNWYYSYPCCSVAFHDAGSAYVFIR